MLTPPYDQEDNFNLDDMLNKESPERKQTKIKIRGKQKFQCPYCTSKFSQKHNLKMHVKQKHDENFETTDFRNISRIDEYKKEHLEDTLKVEQFTTTIKENPKGQ